MAGRKENDEISKLLDSFAADGALGEKMEGFAAKKRRQDKYTQQINMIDVDDTQETKTPTANDTIVLRHFRYRLCKALRRFCMGGGRRETGSPPHASIRL